MEFPPSTDTASHELYYELNKIGTDGSQRAVDRLSRTISELDIKDDASSTITGPRSLTRTGQHGHEYDYARSVWWPVLMPTTRDIRLLAALEQTTEVSQSVSDIHTRIFGPWLLRWLM